MKMQVTKYRITKQMCLQMCCVAWCPSNLMAQSNVAEKTISNTNTSRWKYKSYEDFIQKLMKWLWIDDTRSIDDDSDSVTKVKQKTKIKICGLQLFIIALFRKYTLIKICATFALVSERASERESRHQMSNLSPVAGRWSETCSRSADMVDAQCES